MNQNIKKTVNRITPSLLNAYYICKRKAWLQSRGVNPDKDDTNLSIGRIIDKESYKRKKKSISIDNMKIDVIEDTSEGPCICEVKKSSAGKSAAVMQIAYYLYKLRSKGIEAKGRLLLPKEKKRETIELDDDLENRLLLAIKDLETLLDKETPPSVNRNKFCKKCAYFEFCFS